MIVSFYGDLLHYSSSLSILRQEIHKEVLTMERVPTTLYLWVSRAAGFVGIVCIIIALVTSATDSVWIALPRTYVLIAIAAFVFAIWALLYELRDKGIKTR